MPSSNNSFESRLSDPDNGGDVELRVPGFGFWYNAELGVRYSHGADDFRGDRLTAREVAMLRSMSVITEKPSWHREIFKEMTVVKWEEEALRRPLINQNAWDWILRELRDKATEFAKTGLVLDLETSSRVCKSDVVVPQELQAEFREAVRPLLNQPDKDWLPGSNDQVLNLVDPSLYPLVFNRSLVLSKGGKVQNPNIFSSYKNTETAPVQLNWNPDLFSPAFQWLPCEVSFVKGSSSGVRITSYINNLHPKNETLYGLIEKLIGIAIEPWNRTIVDGPCVPPRIRTYGAQFKPEMPEWAAETRLIHRSMSAKDSSDYLEALQRVNEYLALPDRPDFEVEPDDEDGPPLGPEYIETYGLYSAVEKKWLRLRELVHPDAGLAYTYEQWKQGETGNAVVKSRLAESGDFTFTPINLEERFGHRGLQVIIRLSSIELQPQKPQFNGSSWQVEGMKNEHIVATAIYYYDVENVSEARISFRMEASLDEWEMETEQGNNKPLAQTFGVESGELTDEKALQDLGSIPILDGRFFAFPNTLQNKVEPLELKDEGKPGHCRALFLWLVDPNYRICSTRNVPPQQHHWWAEQGYDKIDFKNLKIPPKAIDIIRSEVGKWPMGLDEAKKLRHELMAHHAKGTETVQANVGIYGFDG
ncbi:hypothetical protein BGZ63DRAFT_379299 [Mariannaea sp. PMI_226]|nr:hypothetical protein BGZ63DRAFT_379299 [Mariannaea sp. PMI_226]